MAFRVSFGCLLALYRQEVVTMAKAVVVRYETRPDAGDRNPHLIEQVFAELNAEDPPAPQVLLKRGTEVTDHGHLSAPGSEPTGHRLPMP
jgi:hypothetical protein